MAIKTGKLPDPEKQVSFPLSAITSFSAEYSPFSMMSVTFTVQVSPQDYESLMGLIGEFTGEQETKKAREIPAREGTVLAPSRPTNLTKDLLEHDKYK